MAKVVYLKPLVVETNPGTSELQLVDKAGNTFKLPEKPQWLENCKQASKTGNKLIRVTLIDNKDLAYFGALANKFWDTAVPVSKRDFPELWATLLQENYPVSTEQLPPDSGVREETMSQKLNKLVAMKPKRLKLSDIKWKYLLWSALRGRNILMEGEAGSGKTFAAYCLKTVLPDHPFFAFNLGASQDPRGFLIGNAHFNKDSGTFFGRSEFIRAITTPNAIILTDEISRAHPDAWNILMTVLDQDQRYLRIDEEVDTPVINVAQGVTFVATANKGIKYTSTRTMDRALLDRFTTIEFDMLSKEDILDLLQILQPTANRSLLYAVAEIYSSIAENAYSDDPILTNVMSTRAAIETANLLVDGFSLPEASQVAIYPFFSDEGGNDSERSFVKKVVQKFIPADVQIEDDPMPDINIAGLSTERPF